MVEVVQQFQDILLDSLKFLKQMTVFLSNRRKKNLNVMFDVQY